MEDLQTSDQSHPITVGLHSTCFPSFRQTPLFPIDGAYQKFAVLPIQLLGLRTLGNWLGPLACICSPDIRLVSSQSTFSDHVACSEYPQPKTALRHAAQQWPQSGFIPIQIHAVEMTPWALMVVACQHHRAGSRLLWSDRPAVVCSVLGMFAGQKFKATQEPQTLWQAKWLSPSPAMVFLQVGWW